MLSISRNTSCGKVKPSLRTDFQKILRSHMHCLSKIEKKPRISRSCVGHRQLSRRGTGTSMPPLQTKNWGGAEKTLLRMYLTIPVTQATSKRTFSTNRRLKNYLRSTMKQDRQNNCLLTHSHNSITDTLDTAKDCKEVCLCQRTTQKAFWKIWVWVCVCVWLSRR